MPKMMWFEELTFDIQRELKSKIISFQVPVWFPIAKVTKQKSPLIYGIIQDVNATEYWANKSKINERSIMWKDKHDNCSQSYIDVRG